MAKTSRLIAGHAEVTAMRNSTNQRPRRQWARSAVVTLTTRQPCTCRVCGGGIEAGAQALFKTWGIEFAHVGCGWETTIEKEGARP